MLTLLSWLSVTAGQMLSQTIKETFGFISQIARTILNLFRIIENFLF
jgi:hypothetical protein